MMFYEWRDHRILVVEKHAGNLVLDHCSQGSFMRQFYEQNHRLPLLSLVMALDDEAFELCSTLIPHIYEE